MPSTTAKPEQDMVTVYHFGGSLQSPSPSPFALKLMTYLRMAGIKYKSESTMRVSSKGKAPFISYKGKELADTFFIIRFLNNEFNVDLDAKLSPVEKATALAFQRLCEENLYWIIVHNRWFVDSPSFYKQFPMGNIRKKFMSLYASVKLRPAQKSNLMGHGIGRHSKEEILCIGERDLKALSDFLGDKPFFMGEEPTEVDAVIFGNIAQFAYVMPGTEPQKLLSDKFPTLVAYADRMRGKYWSDWDELCLKERKEEAANSKKEHQEKKVEEESGKGDAPDQAAVAAEDAKEENGGEEEQPSEKASEQKEEVRDEPTQSV